jgi:hypothetical protein
MSIDHPFSGPSADAPEDDTEMVDGLERALAQARTKIPNHDSTADVVLPSPSTAAEPRAEADVAFDSSAVMDVLRGAIARYTTGDGHEQGAWVDEDSHPATSVTPAGRARHAAAATGYAPDRRRLAAVVVVLFLLVVGIGFQRFGSGGSEKVKTDTSSSATGQAVTTLARATTTLAALIAAADAPPDTQAVPAGTVKPPTATTAPRAGTTSPPATGPPTTEPPTTEPPTTTTEPPTTTTEPPTTTSTPTTTPCGDPLPPC